MLFNKKLIIWIIVAVLLIAAIIIVIYSKKRAAETSKTPEQVAQQKMLWPKVSADQKNIYYFNNDKEPAFFQYNLDTKEIKMVSSTMDTPDEVIWSPDLKKAILIVIYDKYIFEKYNSPFIKSGTADQTPTKWTYDFETKKLMPLNNNISQILWFDDDRIIYNFFEEKTTKINLANYDGTNWQTIANLNTIFIDQLISMNQDKLFFAGTPGEGIRNLYELDIKTDSPVEKIKDIGEGVLISPDGLTAVFETSENNQTSLSWSPLENSKISKSGFESTITQTTWLNQSKFLSAPNQDNTTDLMVYDTTTAKVKKIASLKNFSQGVNNLQLINNTLFFTSNNYLYKILIKP
jgi:hypothetical protein